MIPFQTYDDPAGNLYMMPGAMVALHSTTATFTTGAAAVEMAPPPDQSYRPAALPGASFQGGNGRNLRPDSSFPGALVPGGFFVPVAPNTWVALGNEEVVLTFDPGDGSAEIADGTGTIATKAAGGTDPGGTYTATDPYGESFNGGSPWSSVLTYEGGADFWPARSALVNLPGSTAQGGLFSPTGWQSWESDDDAAWTLEIDGSGAGELSDGVDIVATRAADAARLYDPTGGWESTTYGAATYGSTSATAAGVASAGTFPALTFQLVDTTGTVSTFSAIEDPTKYLLHDSADGDADLYDESGLIGSRLSGVTTAHPWGTYTADSTGEDRYNGGSGWTYTIDDPAGESFTGEVILQRARPAEGVLWVTIARDAGTDEATGLSGPFWGASLPINTSTEIHWPAVVIDSAGVLTQLQLGPIQWRPAP